MVFFLGDVFFGVPLAMLLRVVLASSRMVTFSLDVMIPAPASQVK